MVLSMAQMGSDGTVWSIDAQTGFAQCYVGSGRWQVNASRSMKAVSCASAGQVWGLDTAGKACVLASSPVQTLGDGAMLALGGRTGRLWVGGQQNITWTDRSGQTGVIPYPPRPSDQNVGINCIVATDPAQGGYALWATTTNWSASPRRIQTLFWDGSAWRDSGAPGLNALSIGLDNSVWGYVSPEMNGALYRFVATPTATWSLALMPPASGHIYSYTVIDPNNIWAVDDTFALYRWDGGSWRQGGGGPTSIQRGWDGALYGRYQLDPQHQQPVLLFNGFAGWVTAPLVPPTMTFGSNSQFVGRDSNAWWTAAGGVQFWPGPTWQDMGGPALNTISGAADGTVWGTDPNNALLRFNGTSWDSMPGQAKQVSVGRSDLVWSLDVNGNAQRWTGAAWEAHGNPGAPLTSIAALADGAVAATARVQQKPSLTMGVVFVWNGSQWISTGTPADQIAGADSYHLAGVSRGPNGQGGALVIGIAATPQTAPADVESLGFAPPNPVLPGTVMTLSWAAFPGAVSYAVKIVGGDGSIGLDQTVTGTSVSYTLQRGDALRTIQGTVQALDRGGSVVALGSVSYYCGSGQG